MRLQSFVAALGLLVASVAARADVISDCTNGPSDATNLPYYFGQEFLVGGSGSFDNISFNFITPTGSAYAIGTGYLYSTLPYDVTPDDLSSTSADLIGTAVASDGVYTFDSSVTLTAGNEYYFYEDTLVPMGAITGFGFATGALDYGTQNPADPYYWDESGSSSNYIVDGTAVTPEPSSIAFLGTGALAIGLMVRRRFV